MKLALVVGLLAVVGVVAVRSNLTERTMTCAVTEKKDHFPSAFGSKRLIFSSNCETLTAIPDTFKGHTDADAEKLYGEIKVGRTYTFTVTGKGWTNQYGRTHYADIVALTSH
jgi:hypothetical protein